MFERLQTVRFGHCDPAGIVFYPRYFEMLNSFVEDWFRDGLGVPFEDLVRQRRIGMPTVSLKSEFQEVSRFGEVLALRLHLLRVGTSSMTLNVHFDGLDRRRASFEQVLVCTDLETHASRPFPDDLREALERNR
jgi:4-hydroxybenzoyl-CoA thioesterase